MITGAHVILFSPAAHEVRAFLVDKLGFAGVDAGGGWTIFALPPAELAVHPDDGPRHELYLMCDDVHKTVADLRSKGVEFTSPISDRGWGLLTRLKIPGGGEIGLYQPRHPRPSQAR